MATVTNARWENATNTQVGAKINGCQFIGIYPDHPLWCKVVADGVTIAPYVAPPVPTAAEVVEGICLNNPALMALGKALAEKFNMTPAAFLALVKSKA